MIANDNDGQGGAIEFGVQIRESEAEKSEVLSVAFAELALVETPPNLIATVLQRTGIADLYWQMESPIGLVFVAASRVGITAVSQPASGRDFETHYRARFRKSARPVDSTPRQLAVLIDRWLSGDRRKAPPFDLAGLTEFESTVLHKAMEIPRGQVRPYGWIAREIGTPRSARAVGTALAKNPVPLLIPCHRVVRGDGVIGNYVFGSEAKRTLLEYEHAEPDRLEALAKEGIRFVGSDTTHIFCLPTCRYNVSEQHLMQFSSEREARAAGYRPCKVCRPALAS